PARRVRVVRHIGEVLRLRVHLGRVHVDAEPGVPLAPLGDQGVQVLESTGTGVVVAAVVGVRGVVTLGAVALEERLLAEAVGGQVDALDVVEGAQERVGGPRGEVERDVADDRVRHVLAADGVDEDVAVGDPTVLPVHDLVVVAVAGEHDVHLRQGDVGRVAPGDLGGGAVGPAPAPHAELLDAVDLAHLPQPALVVHGRAVRGSVVGRVGLEGGGVLVGVDDDVGRAGDVPGRRGLGDLGEAVARGAAVDSHAGGRHARTRVVGTDRDEVVSRDLDRSHVVL